MNRGDVALDLRILDLIECEELAPLSWGLVDGGFSDDELLDLLDSLAEKVGDDRSSEEIKQSLEERALIVEVESIVGKVWRTRMAESVRLFARMRQLFPRHLRDNSWHSAPSLVSDYRFMARRRRFPRRDIASTAYVATALPNSGSADPLRRSLQALADGGGAAIEYSGFQARAAQTILGQLATPGDSATLIAAGTSSGKTKAFYLPALAALSTMVDGDSWTKLVAIYPRKELLKDQLLKTLLEHRVLKSRTGISLSIGALYGDVPLFAKEVPSEWPRRGQERVCPYLVCPSPSCGQEMYWYLDGQVGALRCSRCSERVRADELLLSRQQQQAGPPDVLLATTEMLNRSLSNDYSRHVVGVGLPPHHRPRLLLLDEVHTFTGSLGAQTGLLLRRWRHAVGQSVHTVALSATIEDGVRLMSQLVGISPDDVALVEPSEEELVEGGQEYLLALRSDPASKTALLSSTIQAAMLLRRVLDRPVRPKSNGAYGTKAFVFTDDLDVTNRLLHFLRNAEGQTDQGRADLHRSPDGSLANLRSHIQPLHRDRLLDGQSWDLCHSIGHLLHTSQDFRVERTSSQDPGLERKADIVVATASLEVGLDDNSVGGVIQHKAPRDAAAFIQRRGRAGREQMMRPWTAVVLSDYGRDRQAFQAWDTLFDPILRPEVLPMTNRHILRMQATFCLLDWIADRLRVSGAQRGYIWTDISGPTKGSTVRRSQVVRELDELLDIPSRQDDLRKFVSEAMGCSQAEVERLFWHPPRAVLGTVVPTLRRRLHSGWQRAIDGDFLDVYGDAPLPDFLPSALFADLLVPEVAVRLPPESRIARNGDERGEYMGVHQALREFAPGKVTHRFAVGDTRERLWIDPRSGDVDVTTYFQTEPLTSMVDSSGSQIEVLRPSEVKPVVPERAIASSSTAWPRWISSFSEVGAIVNLPIPVDQDWGLLLASATAHAHQLGGHLVIHRATTGAEGTIRDGATSSTFSTHYVCDGEAVALGFRLDADAVVAVINDPMGWEQTLSSDTARARSLRVEWFRHNVVSAPELQATSSAFLLGWLAEVALALVTEQGFAAGSLEAGVVSLGSVNLGAQLDQILSVVFQSTANDMSGSADEDDVVDVTAMHRELVDLAVTPEARVALARAAEQLVLPDGEGFHAWLRDRYAVTVAGALLRAVADLDSQIRVDDLIVDVTPWIDGQAKVILSESQPGGVGVVERIVEHFQQDPKKVWRLLRKAVGESESELVDRTLVSAVRAASSDDAVAKRFADFRASLTQQERRTNWQAAIASLEGQGLQLSPALRMSLTLRLFRPGSTHRTDRVLHQLIEGWSAAEQLLGIQIDGRVFAYLSSEDTTIDNSLEIPADAGLQTQAWRFGAILSMLWGRGGSLRSRHLELWSPFVDLELPERTLLAERIPRESDRVRVLSAESSPLLAVLADSGEAELCFGSETVLHKQELLRLIAEPVEVGVLELYPRIVGIGREADALVVRFEVPEVRG